MTRTVEQPTVEPPALPPVDVSGDALAAVTAQLAATAEEHDRSAGFPWAGIQAVHDAGLLRLGIAPRYGGAELNAVDSVRVFAALGQGDPSVALITAMTVFQHVLQSRDPWWPDELYREVVRDSRERPVLVNAIRAEHELGAPARGGLPATTIRRTASGWVLNGHKAYATGSEGLAYHLVWAATEDADPLQGHAIVPGDSPGIRVERTWDHLGLRASSTHDAIYTDVEIPAGNFQGTPASEHRGDVAIGGVALGAAALYLGVARAARDFFARFARERVPTALGRPIATTERIQTVAGEIEAQLLLAEEIAFGLARRIDAGESIPPQRLVLAKPLIVRAAVTAVQTAVAAIGNPALTRHNPLERHLRDVLCARVHPPQEDTALLVAGRRALGL
ncbi:acyl-CoA dehydrogenase family protein [Parafrankia discariae]|uniref:acyl-CoA dehydrogenase family protein n=1 Tax=Parafrankia discariae TaxID=365528 RepID=UPI00039EFD54|nr:acyl-CoA dehydrogenase family protein [Parafrankia discariae]